MGADILGFCRPGPVEHCCEHPPGSFRMSGIHSIGARFSRALGLFSQSPPRFGHLQEQIFLLRGRRELREAETLAGVVPVALGLVAGGH